MICCNLSAWSRRIWYWVMVAASAFAPDTNYETSMSLYKCSRRDSPPLAEIPLSPLQVRRLFDLERFQVRVVLAVDRLGIHRGHTWRYLFSVWRGHVPESAKTAAETQVSEFDSG